MLRYLPNALTLLRLVLALPLGYLIIEENFQSALVVAVLAGISDGLDGAIARRLGALSRVGAVLDPIADKTLITVCFLGFAAVELIPWYLAGVVILRDLVIVSGAVAYRLIVGPFEFAATSLSKLNMLLQVCFCLLALLSQVVPGIPAQALLVGAVAVIAFAVASGADYVVSWTRRALRAHRERGTG